MLLKNEERESIPRPMAEFLRQRFGVSEPAPDSRVAVWGKPFLWALPVMRWTGLVSHLMRAHGFKNRHYRGGFRFELKHACPTV